MPTPNERIVAFVRKHDVLVHATNTAGAEEIMGPLRNAFQGGWYRPANGLKNTPTSAKERIKAWAILSSRYFTFDRLYAKPNINPEQPFTYPALVLISNEKIQRQDDGASRDVIDASNVIGFVTLTRIES